MRKSDVIAVGIIGGNSFGAGELLRLLVHHPLVRVVSVSARSGVNQHISEVHPHLARFYDFTFVKELEISAFDGYLHKVIFCALPHGVSSHEIQHHYVAWQQAGIRCIDLSGDLRIQNHTLHQWHYPESPLFPELRKNAVYGLTELLDKQVLQKAVLVSNPGCLATAAIISLMPIQVLSVAKTLMINLATGSSGSGKEPKASTHHPTRHANFYAYKPLNHQHEGEIIEAVKCFSGRTFSFNLIPQSLPVSRGILCTTYLTLTKRYTIETIHAFVEKLYENFPFIRFTINKPPELQHVVGSNFVQVSVFLRDRTLVVMAALDNLIKGMAGQAIQNMNVMFSLPQETGLWFPAIKPI